MKKQFKYFVMPLFLAFFFSCNVAGGEDKLVAPDMGTSSDIKMGSVTSTPQNKSDAVELYTTVSSLILTEAKSSALSSGSSRATNTEKTPISWTDGDAIFVTGTLENSIYIHDSFKNANDPDFVPPQGNYDPLMTAKISFDLKGTFTDAVLDDTYNLSSYTINGKFITKVNSSASASARIGSSKENSTVSAKMSVSTIYGAAISIVRNDGFGAKFILSFADSFSAKLDQNNVSEIQSDFEKAQAETMVDVKVYDNQDTLIDSYQVSLSELGLVTTPSLSSPY